MTGVPINPGLWIATRFDLKAQRNFDVFYALILRIMTPEFGAGFLERSLIK